MPSNRERAASEMEPLAPQRPPAGLPELAADDQEVEAAKARQFAMAILLLPRVVCFVIAFLIYKFGDTDGYNAQLAFFSALTGNRWGFLYMSVVVFSVLSSWLQAFPTVLQARVMGVRDSPDVFVYRAQSSHPGLDRRGERRNWRPSPTSSSSVEQASNDNGEKQSYILLEEEGAAGSFNRANRSLHQFAESSAAVALTIPFAGSVFPVWALVCTLAFCLGRVWHQWGSADDEGGSTGAQRGGAAIALCSSTMLEMMVFVIALRIFGVFL